MHENQFTNTVGRQNNLIEEDADVLDGLDKGLEILDDKGAASSSTNGNNQLDDSQVFTKQQIPAT